MPDLEFDFDFSVNGKEVHLRRKIPMAIAPKLPAMLEACDDGDLRTQVKVMVLMIESWDFPGQPNDPKSYEALDIIDELLPIGRHIGKHVLERLGSNSKN